MTKQDYDLEFDLQLYRTMKLFADRLIIFHQLGRAQECREFGALINKPLAETNKYLHLWGLGW